MNTLRIAVIGVGTMGAKHLNVVATTPGIEAVGAADLLADRLARETARYGAIPRYADYRALLTEQRPDAVVVALPDHLHREPVIDCMNAGAHVLVEKPLATTLNDCDAMIDAADRSGRALMVNYSHRWVPAYYMAHEQAASGKLGRPLMAYAKKDDTIGVVDQWPWLRDSSPAAFLASHDIDLVRWFVGSEVETVYAHGVRQVLKERYGYDTYDCIQALVRFESGAFATFEAGWIYPDTYPTMTDSFIQLTCERGVIQLPRCSETLEIATESGYTYPRIGITAEIDGRVLGAFRTAHEHFYHCIRSGAQPLTTGRDAYQVAAIVDAIHRSLESGKVERCHKRSGRDELAGMKRSAGGSPEK